MSKYPFSQLIREILSKIQGARTLAYEYKPSPSNAVVLQNFLTEGGPILNDFFVTPPRSAEHSFVVPPRNRRKNRGLQLRKEGI